MRRLSRHTENSVGLVVDQRQTRVARDRQDAIPHPRDDVPEKRIGRTSGAPGVGTDAFRPGRGPVGSSKTRFGHHTVLQEQTSAHSALGKRCARRRIRNLHSKWLIPEGSGRI
jgi:hypothetical protein